MLNWISVKKIKTPAYLDSQYIPGVEFLTINWIIRRIRIIMVFDFVKGYHSMHIQTYVLS